LRTQFRTELRTVSGAARGESCGGVTVHPGRHLFQDNARAAAARLTPAAASQERRVLAQST
jgi:hypothetical protein